MDNNREDNNVRNQHLEELSHSDYKIAEDQADIDDWKILNAMGEKVGEVEDLLFDTKALKVRYIVTNLKDGDFFDDDRKVLIPIGQARLDRGDKKVIIPSITKEQLSTLPRYGKADDLDQEDEMAIRNVFTGAGVADMATGSYDQETFYDHEDFNEGSFYDHDDTMESTNRTDDGKIEVIEEDLEVGKREVETGGARVTSRIVERPVEEKVNLRKEHVEVKRTKVDRPASSSDLEHFKEETVEMHETSEVPVVNKVAHVVEEISIEKDVEDTEEVVKDTVRSTEVDVDQMDDDSDRTEMEKREREKRNRNL